MICYRAMNTRPRQQIMTVIAIALTFGSGAMDVASFTRLGNVFTSVMTGNIVLWGLAAAGRSVSLASHTAVSIAGYIAGVALGTWVAHGFKAPDKSQDSVLPAHVHWAMLAELVLLAGFTGGWEATGASPHRWAQFCLLAVAAAAMGVQSSAVRDMGLSDVSTTYLTGTLTGLVSSLVSPGKDTQHGVRRFGVLFGLLAGALLSGVLVATAADAVPALPLTALILTLVLARLPLRQRKPSEMELRPGRGASGRRAIPVDAVVALPRTRNVTARCQHSVMSELKGRGAVWTLPCPPSPPQARGTSDEGRQRLKSDPQASGR
jgi:uncharacterized membrane protein YoaK (UPF0700 family)